MYTTSIIMLLSWPALIVVAWFAVRFALYHYERKQKKVEKILAD